MIQINSQNRFGLVSDLFQCNLSQFAIFLTRVSSTMHQFCHYSDQFSRSNPHSSQINTFPTSSAHFHPGLTETTLFHSGLGPFSAGSFFVQTGSGWSAPVLDSKAPDWVLSPFSQPTIDGLSLGAPLNSVPNTFPCAYTRYQHPNRTSMIPRLLLSWAKVKPYTSWTMSRALAWPHRHGSGSYPSLLGSNI